MIFILMIAYKTASTLKRHTLQMTMLQWICQN